MKEPNEKTNKSSSSKKKEITPVKKVNKSSGQFPIVAIGSSAGGLEAVTELLKTVSPNTGMAFIYVQHLGPDHKSMLPGILSRITKMKVQEIEDMDTIKPNEVFVIPSNKGIEVTDGHIKLIPRSASSTAISIDILFASLAEANKDKVIGIILSGNASDGTAGMKAIKQYGGLTFAQDSTAKFASMPTSVITAGLADFILSPKEIALELNRLSKHPFVKTPAVTESKEELIDNNDPQLKIILKHLHKATGVDFSQYKMNTIKRRMVRRMLLYKIEALSEYAKLLGERKEEVNILYQDLLINVTSFFRDTETHQYLKTTLLPKLLKGKNNGEALRIWVPACASGEEAYSIAMMLLEIQDTNQDEIGMQVFATDLSPQAISKARIGLYTREEVENVSPKRLQRFFTHTNGKYRIAKAVRDLCIFAPHNLLNDPPFSRLDFISCCNLFIYFDSEAQKKAAITFHYALNEKGLLMLGKSETINASPGLFTPVNNKHKVFARINDTGITTLPWTASRFSPRQPGINDGAVASTASATAGSKQSGLFSGNDVENAVDLLLLAEFMPAAVAINHAMDIVLFRGATDLYLTHPKGKASFNILKMAPPEMAFVLRSTILKAIKTKQRVRKTRIEIKGKSAMRSVNIEAVQLQIASNDPLLLIIFTEHEQVPELGPSEAATKRKAGTAALHHRIEKLEKELAAAHSEAITFSQVQERYIEELQSANEEVVSSNEELQSVNEELETSKEEIQSANEELTTANQELQTRNELLNEAYDFSEAIIATMHEPMIVLDKNLRIKFANRSFYQKFKVKAQDTQGMLLYDLGNKQWDIPRLRKLLRKVITQNSHLQNFEISHNFLEIGEKVMLLNACRVNQKAHMEQLILLSIADVTQLKILEKEKEAYKEASHKKEIEQQKEQSALLEESVKQRTADLTHANQSLLSMNKELEAFNFISSHDLQEPLRKIQVFAGRIVQKEESNLSPEGKQMFGRMQEAANKMRRLIDDLLAFSQLDVADRKFEVTDLTEIVEEVKKDLHTTIEEKGAEINSTELCKTKGILFQLRQLFYNLVSNALKFSNAAVPPRIVIQSEIVGAADVSNVSLTVGKEYCHISISDNGIGFEEEFAEKIFGVFQRLHGKDEYEGTGIGLAIVKKIVDNHNGVIKATSSLHKGATFDIYIPTDE